MYLTEEGNLVVGKKKNCFPIELLRGQILELQVGLKIR